MAPQLARNPYLRAEEHLAFEQKSCAKHECINDEIYAMAGASDAHVTVSGNVFVALKSHLPNTPCRSFIADMKLHVRETGAYFYPDVFVICKDTFPPRGNIKTDVVLIVEASSLSTEACDRGVKFAHYRYLPGLREYLPIDNQTRTVDLYRNGDEGLWVLHLYSANDVVELASVGLSVPVDDVIFEDVEQNPPREIETRG
ncbi:MAG: Uma2 family endonuclease [Pseudomonadota bacterium]